MTELRPSQGSDDGRDGVTLRLLWPQWQGPGTSSAQELAAEFPFAVAPPWLRCSLGGSCGGAGRMLLDKALR
jgi:hypothetical protein